MNSSLDSAIGFFLFGPGVIHQTLRYSYSRLHRVSFSFAPLFGVYSGLLFSIRPKRSYLILLVTSLTCFSVCPTSLVHLWICIHFEGRCLAKIETSS